MHKEFLNCRHSLATFLLLALMLLPLPIFAQGGGNINLEVRDRPLKEVFAQIEDEYGYRFIFRDDAIDLDRKVTVSVKNASIDALLGKILDSKTEYQVRNRQITIYIKPDPRTPSSDHERKVAPGTVVKGTVRDVENEPIVGAFVQEKGTRNGVTTDLDGNWSIAVSSPDAVLLFSCLGFRDIEMPASSNAVANITMQEDMQRLDEVVVIGYGTQTKATITGSLSVVDTKELIKPPVSSITNVLAGSVPGVATVQTTGQPGEDAASIYIRGVGSLSSSASAPLVLVDGVERDFSQIDPNEIENFSILKDAASTAVFGVRGANGVILITTKRGQEGKPNISISTNTGLQQPSTMVSQVGSYEYARYWNMKMQNDGETDPRRYFTDYAIEAYRTGSDPLFYPNVNWKERVFNDVFVQTKNNINISGGGKVARYFVSMGYLYQNGVLKQVESLPYNNNYNYNRYNYRANLDFSLSPSTTMKFNIGGYVGKQQAPLSIKVDGTEWNSVTIWTVPLVSPGLIDGKRTRVPASSVPTGLELNRDGYFTFFGRGYEQYYNTTLNIDVEINQRLDFITDGLSLTLKGAYDNAFNIHKKRESWADDYNEIYYASYYDDPTKPMTDPDYDRSIVMIPRGTADILRYSEENGRDRNWYLEGKINWDRAFGPKGQHKVSAMFLYNQSRDYYPKYSTGETSSYQYIPHSYVGFVGRATYNYKGKYLADLSIGYNGSENFAPGKTRYGAFPSGSIGWVISEEGFMKNQNFISYLKLRASLGKVGNDLGTTRFMYMPTTWVSNGNYNFGETNPNSSEAYGEGVIGNDGVTWETAVKQNYGIDAEFLRHRLSLNFDWFFEHRTGILLKPNNTPAIIAYTLPSMNLGEVNNHGYEISLGWSDKTKSGFEYFATANVSFARNKIIFMDEVVSEFPWQNQTGGSVGRYTGLYKFVRLYQYSDFTEGPDGTLVLNPELPQPSSPVYPGDAMYEDVSGDGIVNSDDTMVTGYSTIPEYVFGLNAGFNFKGFNFSMQWTGATNVNKLMDEEYRIPFTNAGGRGLLDYFYEDGWTVENQDGTLPRASEKSETWNSQPSTLWLRDASYLRLKTVTLGYTFPGKGWLKAIGVKSLNVSFSGYNLLTFTGLDFIDPESLTDRNGAYPLVKIYSLGLNLTF